MDFEKLNLSDSFIYKGETTTEHTKNALYRFRSLIRTNKVVTEILVSNNHNIQASVFPVSDFENLFTLVVKRSFNI